MEEYLENPLILIVQIQINIQLQIKGSFLNITELKAVGLYTIQTSVDTLKMNVCMFLMMYQN